MDGVSPTLYLAANGLHSYHMCTEIAVDTIYSCNSDPFGLCLRSSLHRGVGMPSFANSLASLCRRRNGIQACHIGQSRIREIRQSVISL